MFRYVILLLLVFVVQAQAQKADNKTDPDWRQPTYSDGSLCKHSSSPVRAAGATYACTGAADSTGNGYWSLMLKGKATGVKTADGNWFIGSTPKGACGVVLSGQYLNEGRDGIRFWRLTGALAEPLTNADGTPFIDKSGKQNPFAVAISGPGVCPYFAVQASDSSTQLFRLDGLKVARVALPANTSNPRYAWNGKHLFVCGGKKCHLLGEKEPIEVKDAAGASINAGAFMDLACTGEFLLVNGGHQRCRLYRLKDGVATKLDLAEGQVVVSIETRANKHFALVAQLVGKKYQYELNEIKDGKCVPLKTFDKWKDHRLTATHASEDARVLQLQGANYTEWVLVLLRGGEAKELFSSTSEDSVSFMKIVSGSADKWLLDTSTASGRQLWLLDAAKPASRLRKPFNHDGYTVGDGDAHGFYLTVEPDRQMFLVYREC